MTEEYLKVNLREFANLPEERILGWRGYRVGMEVTDDAGETVLTDSYSMMLVWQGLIVHRKYNDLPYSVKEVIPSNAVLGTDVVYNDKTLSTTINYTLERVMPSITDPVELDYIKRLCSTWQNKLNNMITVMTEEYVSSATDNCVIDLLDDPTVLDIRRRVLERKITIDEGEVEFTSYIQVSKTLIYNTLVRLARTGGISINQTYQKVVVRGALFDLGNNILPNPAMSNYGEGMVKLIDVAGDSRTTGKSLNSNGKALEDTEWFHRKTHTLTSPIREVFFGVDCGNTDYIPIKVSCKPMAASLLGAVAFVQDVGEREINNEFVSKVKTGDVVYIRSPAFCRMGHHGGVCAKCYGGMKSALPYNPIIGRTANVGMYSSTTLVNPMGQGMLSTKHFIRNAVTKTFEIYKRDIQLFTSDGDQIFLKEEMLSKKTHLYLRTAMVKDLSDLKALDSINDASIEKLMSFSEATFVYEIEDEMIGGTTQQIHTAQTHVSARQSKLSFGLVDYINRKGWEVVDKHFISIDMSEWNPSEPLFYLPHTREDLDVHRARVENFLTFNKRNNAWRKQVVTPRIFGETLAEFWTLINQELKGMNMIHIQILLSATLTRDPENNNFSLAMGAGDKYFTSFEACIQGRGFGSEIIYENQQGCLSNAKTYAVTDRTSTSFESFFHPVLE